LAIGIIPPLPVVFARASGWQPDPLLPRASAETCGVTTSFPGRPVGFLCSRSPASRAGTCLSVRKSRFPVFAPELPGAKLLIRSEEQVTSAVQIVDASCGSVLVIPRTLPEALEVLDQEPSAAPTASACGDGWAVCPEQASEAAGASPGTS